MKFIKGFFENNGEASMTRLLCLLYSVFAMFGAGFVLIRLHDVYAAIALFVSYSGVAVSFKLGQKSMEVKKDNNVS